MNSVMDVVGLRKASTYTMMGKEFTFFLGNEQFGESYYSYQIYSPGLSDDHKLIVSLAKVTERVPVKEVSDKNKKGEIHVSTTLPHGKDVDLLSFLTGAIPAKWDAKKQLNYFKNLLNRGDEETIEVVAPINKNKDFPGIKADIYDKYNNNQRTLIINLRDNLRWRFYSFEPGKKFDLLYSTTEFVVVELKEDANTKEYYLEPIAVYKNTDVDMKNPLKVDLDNLELSGLRWTTDKAKEKRNINKSLKIYESNSFTRKELHTSKRK